MNAITPADPDRAAFANITQQVTRTVAKSSARVYAGIYRRWQAYAEAAGVSPIDLRPANVYPYLEALTVGKRTRMLHLHALRSAARVLFIATGDPEVERTLKALSMIRAPEPEDARPERQRRALNPSQVNRLLDIWTGERPIEQRNRALITLLFATGARRSEIAALRWTDLDLADATITIRHGKGDKERVASIAGEAAIAALQTWRQTNAGEYVFPAAWKNGRMRGDEPMTADAVYRIVKQTEQLTGVEFRPHDARRTMITEALATGTPLADVQAQAGHANASTTLLYAQAVDARNREFRLRYG